MADAVRQNYQLQSGRRWKNARGPRLDILLKTFFPVESSGSKQVTTSISVNFAFILYGGLHLLAWQYHFRSTPESMLWKLAGVFTASSGAVPLLLGYTAIAADWIDVPITRLLSPTFDELVGLLQVLIETALVFSIYAWTIVNIAARVFLFVESFVALPNSPPSTYLVPKWTAYVPHI
jgi:hypothetical protein